MHFSQCNDIKGSSYDLSRLVVCLLCNSSQEHLINDRFHGHKMSKIEYEKQLDNRLFRLFNTNTNNLFNFDKHYGFWSKSKYALRSIFGSY